MTTPPPEDGPCGTLRAEGGAGVVRLEHRLAAPPLEVWSALTEPGRLAGWLGAVSGDLRPGGEFTGHWAASDWEGTCRVEACEPPRRLLVHTCSPDQPAGLVEVWLEPDGAGTALVLEDRGVPLADVAAYGAGDQVHVEDLAAHLAGEGRCDARARWAALQPAYAEQAAALPAGG